MRRLVVGIDYGTSNSGVAYAVIGDRDRREDGDDEIDVIKEWPHAGSGRDASDKVPSDIAYDKDGRDIGHGFEIPRGTQPLQWVKLLLEPEDECLKERSTRTARVWKAYEVLGSDKLKKSPVAVVADYLRWLWERSRAVIMANEDEGCNSELFHPQNMVVVLTVPASWTVRGKHNMAKAAVQAGIPEQCIKLLAEPEAAAVYGLKKQARKNALAEGDCVIICDAGGGTVDVVAYQVRSREPLSLDQRTVSKGNFCGSTFIDAEFQNQLRSMLGTDFQKLSEETLAQIDHEFEYRIKRTYNPYDRQSGTSYTIPTLELPDNVHRGIQKGGMRIDNAVLATAFGSIMTQVMSLIDDQVQQLKDQSLHGKLKGIVLVGGFSKSGYLLGRVRDEFPAKKDVKVWSVDNSWTAVVKGAVMCEVSDLRHAAIVRSRVSSFNYGIPYVSAECRRVQWLVRKGEAVEANNSSEPYVLRLEDQPWLDEDEFCQILIPVVMSSEDNASESYNEHVEPHVQIVCRVPTNLRYSDRAELDQKSLRRVWRIPVTLVLFLEGAIISFGCRIEGQEVGIAAVNFFKQEVAHIDGEVASYRGSGISATSTICAAPGTAESSCRADSVIASGRSRNLMSSSIEEDAPLTGLQSLPITQAIPKLTTETKRETQQCSKRSSSQGTVPVIAPFSLFSRFRSNVHAERKHAWTAVLAA